jgi:riboflavin transporter FmnP
MNTKALAATAVFAALTIALNPAFTNIFFYAPFAQGLVYQIWEIPVIVAFLIISPLAGVTISLLNTAVLLVVFPGALPTGPFYNLAATLSMQLGIYTAYVFAKRVTKGKAENANSTYEPKWAVLSTAMGIVFRVVAMTIVLYFALPQNPPIGFAFPETLMLGYLPFAAIFNASLALYTILTAYVIARLVKKNLKLNI